MSQFIRFPVSSSAADLTLGDLETIGPMTLYVATPGNGGNDANPGTSASPKATIQGAIDLIPKRVRHPVTVNIGAGTFDGCILSGFILETKNASGIRGSLSFIGTVETATGLAGLMTGTIASATAGTANSATWGTATVTAAGWTVNQLRGKFLRIDTGTGAGQYKVIAFNDATTITIPGNWTAPTGATFTIVDPTTIINQGYVPLDTDFSFRIYSCLSTDAIRIIVDKIKVTATRGIFFQAPINVQVIRCSFSGNNHHVFAAGGGAKVDLSDSFFTGAVSAVAACIRIGGEDVLAGGSISDVVAQRNVFNASGFVLGYDNPTSSRVTMLNNYYVAITVSCIRTNGNTVYSTGDRTDAVTPGSRIGYDNTPFGPSRLFIRDCDVSNCGTAIKTTNPDAFTLFSGVVSGTGNTTAISATLGSSVQTTAAATLTGTTELSIDGSPFTLAQMRAAVPKVIANVEYGTKVFE